VGIGILLPSFLDIQTGWWRGDPDSATADNH